MQKSAKTPSTVLVSLMDEYGLNPYTLAKDIGMSYSAVRMIALGNIKISAPTALRLAKYFGNTPSFWLTLQQEADLAEAGKDKNLQSSLKAIKKSVKKAPVSKAAVKPGKKTAQPARRKAAAKAPGSKPVSRKKK
jgi:addiction module HigA family antidote